MTSIAKTPQDKDLREERLKHLDKLLLFAPPEQYRKAVQTILFAYLLEQDEIFPEDYHKVIEDISFLIDFLDKMKS
jgi:hypothetical protein